MQDLGLQPQRHRLQFSAQVCEKRLGQLASCQARLHRRSHRTHRARAVNVDVAVRAVAQLEGARAAIPREKCISLESAQRTRALVAQSGLLLALNDTDFDATLPSKGRDYSFSVGSLAKCLSGDRGGLRDPEMVGICDKVLNRVHSECVHLGRDQHAVRTAMLEVTQEKRLHACGEDGADDSFAGRFHLRNLALDRTRADVKDATHDGAEGGDWTKIRRRPKSGADMGQH